MLAGTEPRYAAQAYPGCGQHSADGRAGGGVQAGGGAKRCRRTIAFKYDNEAINGTSFDFGNNSCL